MKRCLDIVAALSLMGFFAVPMLLVAIVVTLTSNGPVLHVCERAGKTMSSACLSSGQCGGICRNLSPIYWQAGRVG